MSFAPKFVALLKSENDKLFVVDMKSWDRETRSFSVITMAGKTESMPRKVLGDMEQIHYPLCSAQLNEMAERGFVSNRWTSQYFL